MFSLNKAQIIGTLTETPEVRNLSNGTSVTDLNLEIVTKAPVKMDKETSTTFLTVTLWRKLAEIAGDFSRKGMQVYVSGRLETDSWTDDSGNTKYKTKMVAEELIILTSKTGNLEPLPNTSSLFGGINNIEIIGNITKNPELKTTPQGSSVTNFSVATNRSWKNSTTGELQQKAEFHNIVAWEQLAEESSKHLPKGRKVYVKGKVQTRSFTSQDGIKRYTTEIVAEEIKSLGHSLPNYQNNENNDFKQESKEDFKQESPEINYDSEIKAEDLPF
jgi:single-strand DNA-binding protein